MKSLLRPFHIAVIDPAARVAELDNFNRLVLTAPEICFSYHLPALFGMSSLFKLIQKPDALIIFGSGASVYDQLPWQEELNSWLLSTINGGCPTLGICYGHQLLAHLYGGKVNFALESREKYKGLRAISFMEKGFWGEKNSSGRFIVSHREIVTELPTCMRSVASSEVHPNEALVHKNLPVWGIQCHPEAGPEFLEHSEIILNAEENEQPFVSGQEFMRKFIQHLLEQRIQ